MAARKLTAPPTAAQRRAFGYARVSTDSQADSGISLEEQEHKIKSHCSENGWQLERVYVDAGISGSTPLSRRPQGAKLLAALRPGDIIVAARMDQCFRSALDALQTIESFKARRISLWLLDLGNDCSGNGISELIITVLAAVAQFERRLISERIKDAKVNLRREGRHRGGTRPFGFQLGEITGRGAAPILIPDPGEQAAIREMFARRAAGSRWSRSATRCVRWGTGSAISRSATGERLSILKNYRASHTAASGTICPQVLTHNNGAARRDLRTRALGVVKSG